MNATVRSVLLASVAGSVRRHERLDDADASRAVERCLRRVERAVEAGGGRLVSAACGEALALFAQPSEALQAAQEMQQNVGQMAPSAGLRLALRIGLGQGAFAEGGAGGGATCYGGEAFVIAAHLAGRAQAGQALMCAATRASLSADWQQRTREVGTLALPGRSQPLRVFELAAAGVSMATTAVFCLRYGGRTWYVDERCTELSIGRDAHNDVEIGDRRGSRRHATIARRGDLVYLIDHSSNGSYVTLKGQGEVFVRDGEFLLHGAGVIAFAASAASVGADCAQFNESGRRDDKQRSAG